jgi:hypothetical protein
MGGSLQNFCPDFYQVLSQRNSPNRSKYNTISDKLDGIVITSVDENIQGEASHDLETF